MSDEKPDLKQVLFIGLIQSFVTSAWIQLGKQKNPLTDKVEVNLKEAQFTINMLEMIEAKTKGNLTEDEQRILANAITELKMNFVDYKLKRGETPPQPNQPKPEEKN
jgi:hypothetical protein